MKKWFTFCLALLMMFSMIACDSEAPVVPNVDDDAPTNTEKPSVPNENGGGNATTPDTPTEQWLNVATYNILHCMDYPSYSQTPSYVQILPDQIVSFADDYDIEILGLNEVDVNCERSMGWKKGEYYLGGSNQPKYIAEQLTARTGEQYYYAFGPALEGALTAAHPEHGISMYGNAVISKYPIVSTRNVQVWDKQYHIIDPDNPKSQIYDRPAAQGGGHFEVKASLAVELDVNGTIVTVISTHFGLTGGEKIAMAEAIKGLLQEIDTPVILMGDMNLGYNEPIIKEFNVLLKPTSTASAPATFVSGSRIDYIFTSFDIATKNLKVPNVKYSDHYPVTVQMMILNDDVS